LEKIRACERRLGQMRHHTEVRQRHGQVDGKRALPPCADGSGCIVHISVTTIHPRTLQAHRTIGLSRQSGRMQLPDCVIRAQHRALTGCPAARDSTRTAYIYDVIQTSEGRLILSSVTAWAFALPLAGCFADAEAEFRQILEVDRRC
jgi:hypothetical protein